MEEEKKEVIVSDVESSDVESSDITIIDVEISKESEEWLKERKERRVKQEDWSKETEYEYIKNIDIINDTIHDVLTKSSDKWYDNFKGDIIIDKNELQKSVDSLKFDLLMEEVVELKILLKYSSQIISNEKCFCVWIRYYFKMDDEFKRQQTWKFDISDIIRAKKTDFLFD